MQIRDFEDAVYEPLNWPQLIDTLYNDDACSRRFAGQLPITWQRPFMAASMLPVGGEGMENLVMGAIFARMNGDPVPVMSCAGSGNKGLTCIQDK